MSRTTLEAFIKRAREQGAEEVTVTVGFLETLLYSMNELQDNLSFLETRLSDTDAMYDDEYVQWCSEDGRNSKEGV